LLADTSHIGRGHNVKRSPGKDERPVTGQQIKPIFRGMKSKPEVDGQIGKIIAKHIRLDKADELFTELSRVGGNAFRDAMTRVKKIVRKLRA
jgi:hypothetical protein